VRLALLVLVIALGGLVGALMARDPGYVLLAYEQTAIETSLWFALLVLVAVYVLIRVAVRLLAQAVRGRGNLQGWTRRRRSRAAAERALRGHLLLAEARWPEARKLLEGSAPHVDAPLLHQLAAARAADAMGDFEARDEWLRAAHAAAPDAELAVGLIHAELQGAAGQWPECRTTLLRLRQQAPRHPRVLALLADCYRHLSDWDAMLELVPELEKREVLQAPALLDVQREAWLGRLDAGADPAELWKQVPKALRREPVLVGRFASALAAQNHAAEAEVLLREAIDHNWCARLVRQYGTLVTADPGAERVAAEAWLRDRPNDPDLLLALGRISLKNRLWARAREYLEASLRIARSPEAQGELGRLCIALGDRERGIELLSQALETTPGLPLPDRDRPPAATAASAQRGLGA
jgi:HemY protein